MQYNQKYAHNLDIHKTSKTLLKHDSKLLNIQYSRYICVNKWQHTNSAIGIQFHYKPIKIIHPERFQGLPNIFERHKRNAAR
jgi:hypothetical protein